MSFKQSEFSKARFARASFCAALFLVALFLVAGAHITCAQGAAPQSKTVDDVTITLLGARWIPLAQAHFNDRRSGFAPPAAVFAVDYRVDAPEVAGPARMRAMRAAPVVEAITPDGRRLRGNAIGPPQDGVQTRVWNDFYGIDPRWPRVELEFTWRDPQAPENAGARFRESLEWTNIPLPPPTGQSLPLNLIQTTESGTRLYLESAVIQGRKSNPDDKRLYVIGRWLPPESTPDLCAEIKLGRGARGERLPSIAYDTGEPMQDRTHHNNVSPGKSLGVRDETAGYFTVSASAPPAEAKTVTLRLDIEANAPSREQQKWHKRFHFSVPPGAVPLPAGEPAATGAAPLAEAPLGQSNLQLISLRPDPGDGYKQRWRGEIVLRAPADATPNRQWSATGAKWYSEPGRNVTSTGLNPTGSAWLENGARLGPNDRTWMVSPHYDNNHELAAASKLTLETSWKETEVSSFALDFSGLPVPEAGKILTPDAVFSAGEWGQFFVRKIGAFDQMHSLSPRLASRTAQLQPPYGLAVVLEYVPKNATTKIAWGQQLNARTWGFGKVSARDATGRSLVRTCDRPTGGHISADDLDPSLPVIEKSGANLTQSQTAKSGYFLTLYLLPPAPEARTFSLQLPARAEKILQTQTVIWPDIVLPALAPSP